MSPSSDGSVDVSFIVCTYNRANDLREMLGSLAAQSIPPEFSWEIVIVDNNSSDHTKAVVQEIQATGTLLIRYFFEPRQGRSYALNTALAVAKGKICAIADDDLLFPPEYLERLWSLFTEHPEVSIVGGRVLPRWGAPVPDWLTAEHWEALALTNYGDQPFFTNQQRPLCLLAAAFRRQDLLSVGEYDVRLGVSGKTIGGMEDSEIYRRAYAKGMRGLYDPALYLFHKVEPHRMEKRYHRRWHFGHGRQSAHFVEPGSFRFLGAPAYVYRMFLVELGRWLASAWKPARFVHEARLYEFAGVWWQVRRL